MPDQPVAEIVIEGLLDFIQVIELVHEMGDYFPYSQVVLILTHEEHEMVDV